MLKRFNRAWRSLGEHFDTAVLEVFHIPANLMFRRRTLCKIPVSDALHLSADQKLPRDHFAPPELFCRFKERFANPSVLIFTKPPLGARINLVKRLSILLIVIFAATAVLAQQRPLLTDDVDITPPGAFDLAAGVDFFQDAKFPLSGIEGDLTRVGDIRIRTGLASNVEFQIEGAIQNYVAINSRGPSAIPLTITGNSTNDFDDFTISAKIKLRNEGRTMPALGFKFGYQMPNTNQALGIGTNQINIFGKVLLQKRFGRRPGKTPKFNTYGNVGLGIMTAPIARFTQNDVFLYGLAGIYCLTNNVNVVGEVNGRMNTRGGTAPLGTESIGQFRIGTQIKASGLRFDTAAAIGLTKFSPHSGIIFGVTYQTPNVFTPAK
jgi:hypothetical protein